MGLNSLMDIVFELMLKITHTTVILDWLSTISLTIS